MVWDGGSKPLVVPTRWALLEVTLGGAPVCPSSGGVGFTEKSVVRRPPCYLPLEQYWYEMCILEWLSEMWHKNPPRDII